MRKIAIWGHWIVGLIAAAIAAESIGGIAGNMLSMQGGARFGPQVLYADFQFAIFAVFCALCAWGIIKWRRWAHLMALGVFAFEVYASGLAMLVGDAGPLYFVTACFVMIWLLLPSVRRAYWRSPT
jgi:hypothetical protein